MLAQCVGPPVVPASQKTRDPQSKRTSKTGHIGELWVCQTHMYMYARLQTHKVVTIHKNEIKILSDTIARTDVRSRSFGPHFEN